jgi:tripartite-type tricarboxylate transporter receptor subunit TctC
MKKCLRAGLGLFLMVAGIAGIAAAEYPERPINCIVPVEAGADVDIMNRKFLEKASRFLGKPIIVVNKPGAGQTIGYRETYQAKPDGYTICSFAGSIVAVKLLGLLPYDHHDFTPICLLAYAPPIIISSTKTERPFNTFEEVISFGKANPGKIRLLTSAAGGSLWVTAQLLQEVTGVKFNIIPQEGSAGFVIGQLAGGHGDIATAFPMSAKPQIEAGSVRFLAVAGSSRLPGKFSNVKTLKEYGYDVSLRSTNGYIGPPKMPKEIVEKLVKVFEMAAKDTEVQEFHDQRFAILKFLPPEQATEFLDGERDVFRRVLGKSGMLKEK